MPIRNRVDASCLLTGLKARPLCGPPIVLVLFALSVPSAIAQAPAIDQVIGQVEAAQSRFPGVSAVVHNNHFDVGLDALIAKVKAQPLPRGGSVFVNGNGNYDFFAAFNGDQDLWVGGRDSTISLDPNAELEGILRSERTVNSGDKTYSVEVARGTSLAIELGRQTNNLGIKDFGWRIPQSLSALPHELRLRRFQITGESEDPKWGRIVRLHGDWNYLGYPESVTISLAVGRDYLIVQSEMQYANGVMRFHVNSMEKVNGFWIPTDCESNQGDRVKDDVTIKDSYQLSDIHVGGLTAAQWRATLNFNLVMDGKTGKKYHVSSTGERFLTYTPPGNNVRTFVWGWLYTASITTLLVLMVGAYVRWKYRQLTKPA